MVETGNRWNYINYPPTLLGDQYDGPYRMTYSYWVSNDTTIGQTKYKKLMRDAITYEETRTYYVGACREDTVNQQVFFKLPGGNEQLTYAFNHTIGDTIRVDSIGDLSKVVIRYVNSIDSINLGEIQRKRFEIVEMCYNYNETTPFFVFTDYWIEGIGSLKQLPDMIIYPYMWTDAGLGGPYELALHCFWHNDEQIYHNPMYDSCVYASPHYYDIKRINAPKEIILYPNPVSGLLYVSCNEPLQKIELLDMGGNVLRTTAANELDVSKLAEGVYFIRMTPESARVLIERFIKQEQ
jgi:hypothetical protein